MKKVLLSLVLGILCVSCYQPERNCRKFKTGTFEFKSYIDGKLVATRFVRKDSIEIDYFRGEADTSYVRWINNCEYVVRNKNPETRSEEKAIHMKILTTTGDSYTFEYGLVGSSEKQRGTAVRIE